MTQQLSTFLWAIAASLSLASVEAGAQQNQPFDFSYSVSGSSQLRPSLIFNDGRDIYIQPSNPSAPIRAEGAKSSRQGPYLVIEGLPDSFVLVGAGRDRATVRYEGISTSSPQLNEDATSPLKTEPISTAMPPSQRMHEHVKADVSSPESTADVRSPFAAPTGTCTPSMMTSITSVAIEFGSGSTSLNVIGKQKLEAEALRQGLQKVRVLTAAEDNAKVRTARGIAIGNALVQAGITQGMLSRDGHSTIPGMYEIEFEVSKAIPCIKSATIVSYSNDRLTVIASESDLTELMTEVAQQMNRALVIEGEGRAQSISVQFASVPYLQALARLGDQIKGNATIVLRDKEIVLRY